MPTVASHPRPMLEAARLTRQAAACVTWRPVRVCSTSSG